jgi:hypothetical protein
MELRYGVIETNRIHQEVGRLPEVVQSLLGKSGNQ